MSPDAEVESIVAELEAEGPAAWWYVDRASIEQYVFTWSGPPGCPHQRMTATAIFEVWRRHHDEPPDPTVYRPGV